MWIFFRAPDLATAWQVLAGILTWRTGAGLDFTVPLLVFGLLAVVQLYQETRGEIRGHVDRVLRRSPWFAGRFAYAAVTLALRNRWWR